MGEIAVFVSRSERERIRLIREARAIYDSIFPPTCAAGKRHDDSSDKVRATGPKAPSPPKEMPE